MQLNSNQISLKAITLNVWGIKYISKDVNLRYAELIKALEVSDYDFIALQEVWSANDFERIKNSLINKFPFSNYFHSGLIGSGCCLFSKHLITEVFQARYSLNGFPYKIQHGDWFGGKSVGLARIQFFDMNISIYVTHLHANYSVDDNSDEYLVHRMSQAFELSQFISITSESADFALLMGDLNLMPDELGFKILRDNAFLLDTFTEAAESQNGNGSTCYSPKNSYLNKGDKEKYPDGIRIDYILYKHSNNFRAICKNHQICFGKIPGKTICYSDHDAVSAEFSIERVANKNGFTRHCSVDEYTMNNNEIKMRLKNELIEASNKIKKSIENIYRDQLTYSVFGLLAFLLLFFFNNDHVTSFLKTIFLLIFLVFCVWKIVFEKMIEKKHLQSVHDSMKFILKSRYDHNILYTAQETKNYKD